MKRHLLTLVFLLLGTFVFAQHTIKGIVIDSTSGPLTGATVVLLQASDSVLTNFVMADEKGEFMIKKVPEGDYILQVTFLGYAQYSKPITLNKNKDMGLIKMRAATAELKEIVVKGEHIPIMIKNDTIEYNADAFKTEPNANVEELLKKLPGVEVDRDGTVKAQGEEVTKVYVDGKEFFGDDPTIATKNLPANAVDKVQVFDKKSDVTEFTGVDDGERSKSINLTLKEDKKKGYFGNITVGYGTENRYEGKFNINRFNKKMQLSAIGRSNNINEQGFSISDYVSFMGGIQNLMSRGRGSIRMGGSGSLPINNDGSIEDGFVTSSALGTNFNYDFSKKTRLNLSYFYNRYENDMEQTINRQNFLENITFNSDQYNVQNSLSNNHSTNFTFRHDIDSMQELRVRGSVKFNAGDFISSDLSNTYSRTNTLQNSSDNDYNSTGQNLNTTLNTTYRLKFDKKGRYLVANLSGGIQNDETNGNLSYINSFYNPTGGALIDTTYQRQSEGNDQLNYSAKISFTEPLGKSRYLEFSYNRQNYTNDLLKEFYDLVNGNEEYNDLLSNLYERGFVYDNFGLSLTKNKKKSSLTASLNAQNTNLDGKIIGNTEVTINPDLPVYLLPGLRWRYDFTSSKNIRLNYRTSINEPSLEQLQPIVDNSNPLNLYVGNPDLKPSYRHSVNANIMLYDQFSFTSIFGFFQATYNENTIKNANVTTRQGVQLTTPVNVDNSYSVMGNIGFSSPLRFMKARLRINTNTNYSVSPLLTRQVDDINSIVDFNAIDYTESEVNNLSTRVNVTLENSKKETLDISVGANFGYNTTLYNTNSNANQNFISQAYYTDLKWNITDSWLLTSSMDYTIYSREAFGEELAVPIWKASISRMFLKDQKGQLKLSVFDILNQNIGINRTSSFNYIQDERITSLGRYFLLSFSYSLSSFGGANPGTMPGGMKIRMHGR